MAQVKEDSLLFSLNSLLDHERGRVNAERKRELERQRVELLRKAREAEEEQRREAERKQAEERRLAREAEVVREDALRAEAIRQAEIEKARVSAAAEAERALMAQGQAHQRKLEEIRAVARRSTERYAMIFGFTLAVASVLGAFGIYKFRLEPERERTLATYEHLIATERTRANDAEGRLAQRERKLRELTDELERRASSVVPAPPNPTKNQLQNPGKGTRIIREPGSKGPDACAAGSKWDPLNGCL